MESRDVESIKNKFPSDLNASSEPINDSEIQKEPTNNKIDPISSNKKKQVDSPTEVRRSEHARKVKNLQPDFISSQSIVSLVEGNRTDVLNKIPMLLILLMVEDDPKDYKEAMLSRDAAFWKEAINDEMDSLLYNNT